MTKSIFKSDSQRQRYTIALGKSYAGLGGLFGAYKTAEEAFENAKGHKLYSRVAFGDADFSDFKAGFDAFQKLRNAMQMEKAGADAEMSDILADIDLLGIEGQVRDYYDCEEMVARQLAVREGKKAKAKELGLSDR